MRDKEKRIKVNLINGMRIHETCLVYRHMIAARKLQKKVIGIVSSRKGKIKNTSFLHFFFYLKKKCLYKEPHFLSIFDISMIVVVTVVGDLFEFHL